MRIQGWDDNSTAPHGQKGGTVTGPKAKQWQRVFNDVGKRLDAANGHSPLSYSDIMNGVRVSGRHIGSGPPAGHPTDYCYNRINKGGDSMRFHVFEQIDDGLFQYRGPDYPYNGDVFYPPTGEVVGKWTRQGARPLEIPELKRG